MTWKWFIATLGIPTGISFNAFLPKVDGIYIGENKVKVNAEQIRHENFNKEKNLEKIVGVKVDSKRKKSNIEIWLPCISGDFVGSWMKDWGLKLEGQVKKQASDELNDIMKDVANTIFGCGNWFGPLEKNKKLRVLKKKISSINVKEVENSSKSKKIKMGLDIEVEIDSLGEKSSSHNIEGVNVSFKEKKLETLENYSKFQENMKNKLLDSIKSVLREGKWSKSGLSDRNLENEFKNSIRYSSETIAENIELRNELEKCGKKCLLNGGNGVGIAWNPDVRRSGGAGWFEEKLKNKTTQGFNMALGDALKSMWFNWIELRVVIEKELMRRVISETAIKANSEEVKLCQLGEWGFACPDGGIVWEE